MRDRLIEILLEDCVTFTDEYKVSARLQAERVADILLANCVIVPPCKVEPIITVIKKPFHNRIEVVKNTRYEWNEAQFCFSESEAERVESKWKALAERSEDGSDGL